MERSTNLVMLAHVFPPERFEYPTAEVRARWRRLLSDPSYSCLIAAVDGVEAGSHRPGPVTSSTISECMRPSTERGIGTHLLEGAENALFARYESAHLWVLVENTAAIQLYAHNGWRATDLRRRAEFRPFPAEVQMSKSRPG